MAKILVTFVVLIALSNARACMQSYDRGSLSRHFITTRAGSGAQILQALTDDAPTLDHWRAEEKRLAPLICVTADFKLQSDYAVALLHLGRTQEGVRILESIIRDHPREYNIVANLGTAYELAGRDQDAFDLIEKSIEINPRSHEGTEWVHLKILEAKLWQASDPGWLRTNSVLKYDFGAAPMPVVPHGIRSAKHMDNVVDAIIYQLHERLQFVGAPNAIVGDLLFDLGNFCALGDAVVDVPVIYEKALQFGAPKVDLVNARIAEMGRLSHRYSVTRVAHRLGINGFNATIFIVVGGLTLLWIVDLRRRRKLKLASASISSSAPATATPKVPANGV